MASSHIIFGGLAVDVQVAGLNYDASNALLARVALDEKSRRKGLYQIHGLFTVF